MAKKSNKTEHVLKLITKNDEARDDDFFIMDQVKDESGSAAARSAQEKTEEKPVALPKRKEEKKAKPAAAEPFPEQVKAESAILERNDNLVNIAEILAREKLELVMERMKVCMCKTCVNDVLALALNSLPTKYVTTDSGKQYFQLDIYKKQYETDILAALTKACVRVKASPRHQEGAQTRK